MYNAYGIACDGAASWKFSNDFAKNSVIFGVDNSLSSHFYHCKNNVLCLVKFRLMVLIGINETFGSSEENLC